MAWFIAGFTAGVMIAIVAERVSEPVWIGC